MPQQRVTATQPGKTNVVPYVLKVLVTRNANAKDESPIYISSQVITKETVAKYYVL